MATTTTSDELRVIGNPIMLNHKTDPGHRISNKVKNFMTWVDLIPVNWKLNLEPLFEAQNQSNKGGIGYEFDIAIAEFKKKCKLYGLPEFSGLRILSTSDTIAQEEISNNYDDNYIGKTINGMTANFSDIRDVMRSVGSNLGGDISNKTQQFAAQQANSNNIVSKGVSAISSSKVGKAGLNLLLSGRQISLPKIWKGTEYTPSLSLNVRLISPYGSPKSIQKYVLEPLIYLMLMACPKTNDGITYGGNTYLKVKAYGISDINLGAITNINIKRGGSDVTYNQFSQPLFVDLSITIAGLLPGFACLEDDLNPDLKPTLVDAMQQPIVNSFAPIKSDFGFVSVDNIIRSFQKNTNVSLTDNPGLSGLFGSAGAGVSSLMNMAPTGAAGLATAAGNAAAPIIGGAVGLATQAATVVNTVQSSITSTISGLMT
jgi:hypothetical protein